MIKKRDLATALLGSSVGIILWLTVLSRESTTDIAYSAPLHTFVFFLRNIQRGIRGNLLGNILLFIPFGFLLPIVWNKRFWRITGTGAALSLLIEISQLIMHRGVCDIDDIILNTFGVTIGYALYKGIEKIIIKRTAKCALFKDKFIIESDK